VSAATDGRVLNRERRREGGGFGVKPMSSLARSSSDGILVELEAAAPALAE
jgi:hypothetical protein